jgi:hypothetical protein
MQQHMTVTSVYAFRRISRIKKASIAKTIIAFLFILIILIPSMCAAKDPVSLAVADPINGTVTKANVVWEKTFGGSADDRAFYAVQTGNNVLVVGSSKSIVENKTVGWAISVDNYGNAVWNRTFLEGDGTELRYIVNLTYGFLLVGNEFLNSGDVNGYVVRVDDQGNVLWETIIGGDKIDKLFSAIATPDGFAVFGLTYSYGNGSSEQAWIVKLDENGKVIWNMTYGGSNDSALRTSVLAKDGNYVAAGYINVEGGSNYDFYLLKVAPDGSVIWNKNYGGIESEKAYSMTTASDGYVLVGEVESPATLTDAWVLKVDDNGNSMWNKTVGGKEADSPAYVVSAKDGGLLVAGFTFSFGEGQRDFWLFKINNQGQLVFDITQGNEAFQEAYSVIETSDDAYIMVGWTDPVGHPELIGKATYDFYIVKLSVPKNTGISSFSLIFWISIVLVALLATSILVFKLRSKKIKKL